MASRKQAQKQRGQLETKLDSGECRAITCNTFPLLMEVASTADAVQWALAFLGCMQHLAKQPAIVLDIDGTVLLNGETGTTKCVLHFHSLAQACVANNITVFVITARPDEPENRAYTERQLEKCNIGPVADLYMRPATAAYQTYKYKARKDIVTKGYKILLTIGDQFADISIKEPPREIKDDRTYIGQMSDNMQFGIKLPSEFA